MAKQKPAQRSLHREAMLIDQKPHWTTIDFRVCTKSNCLVGWVWLTRPSRLLVLFSSSQWHCYPHGTQLAFMSFICNPCKVAWYQKVKMEEGLGTRNEAESFSCPCLNAALRCSPHNVLHLQHNSLVLHCTHETVGGLESTRLIWYVDWKD